MLNIFRIVLLIIFSILLISCSTSSYYERYGSSNEKHIVEDESELLSHNASRLSKESVIKKLDDITNSNRKKERFLDEIISYLNTPYKYGGDSRLGIDCSAFTQKVYLNSLDIKIPRTAREQYHSWKVFKDRNSLKFGDLVYFNTSKIYFPGHVGIYLDDDLFAHASSSKGVIVSSMENIYYSSKFVGANRVKVKQ